MNGMVDNAIFERRGCDQAPFRNRDHEGSIASRGPPIDRKCVPQCGQAFLFVNHERCDVRSSPLALSRITVGSPDILGLDDPRP